MFHLFRLFNHILDNDILSKGMFVLHFFTFIANLPTNGKLAMKVISSDICPTLRSKNM